MTPRGASRRALWAIASATGPILRPWRRHAAPPRGANQAGLFECPRSAPRRARLAARQRASRRRRGAPVHGRPRARRGALACVPGRRAARGPAGRCEVCGPALVRRCEVCGLALAPTPSRAPGAYFRIDAALPRGIAASWSTGCAVGPDAKTLPCLRGCQTVSRQGRACGRWAVGDAAADPRAAARHAAAYRCPGGVGVGSCGATQGAHASRRCQPASRCRGRPTWSRPRGAQPGAWFRV